jgi:hypothetical protein
MGCAVLELPISPALGDRCGLLDLQRGSICPDVWPTPLLLAEIVSRARAVIARSLHLSVVALASGVPVHRHRSGLDLKYTPLAEAEGIYFWEDRELVGPLLESSLVRHVAPAGASKRRELDRHWDTIAALVGPTQQRARVATAARLLTTATSALEGSGLQVASVKAERDAEYEQRSALEGEAHDLARSLSACRTEVDDWRRRAETTKAELDILREERDEHARRLSETQLELAWPALARRAVRAARLRRRPK